MIAPVRSSEDLTAAVGALGPVRAIIAPNLMHHLFVGDWMAAYPDALSYGPPGLAAKRPELTFTDELGSGFDEAFGAELQRLPIAGMPQIPTTPTGDEAQRS